MDGIDGRVVAMGIGAGTVIGFLIYLFTANVIFIYLGAGLGVILALGVKSRSDQRGSSSDEPDRPTTGSKSKKADSKKQNRGGG